MSRVMCLALALASLTVPRGLQRFKHHMADLRHWLQKKKKKGNSTILGFLPRPPASLARACLRAQELSRQRTQKRVFYARCAA